MHSTCSSLVTSEEGIGGGSFLNIRSSNRLTRNALTFHTPNMDFRLRSRILAEKILDVLTAQQVCLSMLSG